MHLVFSDFAICCHFYLPFVLGAQRENGRQFFTSRFTDMI